MAFTTAAKPIRRAARSRSVARRGCRMLAMNSRRPYVIVPWPPNALRFSGAHRGAERGFTSPILRLESGGTFPVAREGGTALPVYVLRGGEGGQSGGLAIACSATQEDPKWLKKLGANTWRVSVRRIGWTATARTRALKSECRAESAAAVTQSASRLKMIGEPFAEFYRSIAALRSAARTEGDDPAIPRTV
jgi:hypothetical protein